MTFEQLLPQLLGPLGTLVLALIVIWALVSERVVPRGRLDEKERDRAELSTLLDKALSLGEHVSSAAEDRNRLDRLAAERRRMALQDQIEADERAISGRRRPSTPSR